jgi:hypothetical protein
MSRLHWASPQVTPNTLQGELMLRDGPYMGESDTLMKLSGVYVPESGRLHALLEPKRPVQLPFQAHEADVASPHYRCAAAMRCWC